MKKRIDEFENPWKSIIYNPPKVDDWYLVRCEGYRYSWTAYYDTESNEFQAVACGETKPDLWAVLPNANKDGKGE
jgi:hypothetical protein